MIVFGLYSVLWGKHKEGLEIKEEIPEVIKGSHVNGVSMSTINGDAEANKLSSVAISMPIPEPGMKANPKPSA